MGKSMSLPPIWPRFDSGLETMCTRMSLFVLCSVTRDFLGETLVLTLIVPKTNILFTLV